MSGVQIRQVANSESDMRLDRWFKQNYPAVPFGYLQKILRKGEIRVDGKRAKASQRLEAGQSVRIPPLGDYAKAESKPAQKQGLSKKDEALAKAMVIFRNKDVLAINKPAGLAVQGGTKTERHLDMMLDALRFDADERPRLVHRLDRDTSGVMLLARSRQAASDLTLAFKQRETRKVYWAITVGVPDPEEGRITYPLSKLPGKAGERVVVDTENGKKAVTEFKVLEKAGKRLALVAMWPKTGRTHQLRAHMAALGTPILGDGKYGAKDAFVGGEKVPRQLHLHAKEIDVPGGGPRIKAPLPDHIKATFELFGFNPSDWVDADPFEDI